MNPNYRTAFSDLNQKEFETLEGFIFLLLHGTLGNVEQITCIQHIRKLIFPLEWCGINYMVYHANNERKLRSQSNSPLIE